MMLAGCSPSSGPGDGTGQWDDKPLVDAPDSDSNRPTVSSSSATPATPSAPSKPDAPKLSTTDWIRQAEQAASRGNFDQAQRDLRQALMIQPDSAEALYWMGRLKANQGDLEGAVTTLQGIAIDEPAFGTDAVSFAASCAMAIGDVPTAIQLYAAWIENSPDSIRARRERARFFNLIGRRESAAADTMRIVQRGNANEQELRGWLHRTVSFAATQPPAIVAADAWLQRQTLLATALMHWDQSRPRPALDAVEQHLQGLPGDDEAIALQLALTAELQQFDPLRDSLASAAPTTRTYPNYFLALGDCWRNQPTPTTDPSQTPSPNASPIRLAIGAYLRGILCDPTHQPLHRRLTAAFSALGKPAIAERFDRRRFDLINAVESSKFVAQGQPDDLRAGTDLVASLRSLGLIDQALAWHQILARRHPNLSDGIAMNPSRPVESSSTELPDWLASLGELDLDDYPLPDAPPASDGTRATSATPRPSKSSVNIVPRLVDVAKTVDLKHQYFHAPKRKPNHRLIFEQLGGGAAVLDYDCDGWPDLYLAQAGGTPPHLAGQDGDQLCRNRSGQFADVAASAGIEDRDYTLAVTAGDWNQDGFPDLVGGNLGPNRLWINQGDGTFRIDESAMTWPSDSFTTGVGIADVTLDGLSDLVEINYLEDDQVFVPKIAEDGVSVDFPTPLMFSAGPNRVWRGDATGGCIEQPLGDPTGETGGRARITDAVQPSLGLLIGRLTSEDNRSGLDIFVANDLRPNQFWTRDRSGNWQDQGPLNGTAFSARGETNACMGIAHGDFDGGGSLDLLVTNFYEEWANLYLSESSRRFADRAVAFQIDVTSEPMLGFGAQAIDFENDGDLDLVIANGHLEPFQDDRTPYRMPTQLLRKDPSRFSWIQDSPGGYFQSPHVGRCVVSLDYNRDGRTDVVITDMEDPTAILENQTESVGKTLQIGVVGVKQHRDAIGAQVQVTQGDRQQTGWITTGDGYLGRNESRLSFAINSTEGVEPVKVEIVWPDGKRSTFHPQSAEGRFLAVENASELWPE